MDSTKKRNTLKGEFDLCNNLLDLILNPNPGDLDEIPNIDCVPLLFEYIIIII